MDNKSNRAAMETELSQEIRETESYIDQMMTLELCAAYHARNRQNRMVRACAKRLANTALARHHFRLAQIWFTVAKMKDPVGHVAKLRSNMERALEFAVAGYKDAADKYQDVTLH